MLTGKSITFTTYGAKRHERPPHEDLSVNCLGLRNPYNVAGDMEQTMLTSPGFPVTLGLSMEKILDQLRHKDHLEVGVFCAFGQHRSPFMAQVLTHTLSPLGIICSTAHLHHVVKH